MKVYALPAEVPAPKVDYMNFNLQQVQADEDAHKEQLKAWLISQGYKGKHTGKIYREGVADGYALYMMADGPKSFLVHLPYGDAYQSRSVQYMPKRAVLESIEADARLMALFSKQ